MSIQRARRTSAAALQALGAALAALTVAGLATGTASAATPTALTVAAPRAAAALPADGVLAVDTFSRTSSAGLGASERGGSWSASGRGFSTSVGTARLALARGAGSYAVLPGAAATDSDVRVSMSTDRAVTGGGVYTALLGRRNGAGDYRLKARLYPDRSVAVALVRMVGPAETRLASTRLTGVALAPRNELHLRLKVSGSGTSSVLRAKAYTGAEPARWLLSASDGTAALQGPGAPGVLGYNSASATGTAVVVFDDLRSTVGVTRILARPTTAVAGASFSFAASRPGSRSSCRVDAGAWQPCTSPHVVQAAAGAHTFAVRSTDPDGVLTPAATAPFVLLARPDTLAPDTTLTAGPTQGAVTTSTTVSVTAAATEPGVTFACRLDEGDWTPCATPATFSGLALGTHTLEVRSTDAAGNTDATPVRRTFTVTAPAASGVRPGPTNTGVPAGTTLTPHYGNITITQAGTHLDALDIHGFVTIKAPDVTISRSIIRGGRGTTFNVGLVTNTTPTATNFLLTDSELVPEFPSVWLDGMKGANFTVRRVNSHGTVDNVKIHGDNATVESSWLHDSASYASDPHQNDGPTHNDGVQILGGANIRVVGNDISGAANAAVQVTQDYRAVTRTAVNGNWLDGGACSVNLHNKDGADHSIPMALQLRDNRFGRVHRYVDCAVISQTLVTVDHGGNVWDDNGLPARLRLVG